MSIGLPPTELLPEFGVPEEGRRFTVAEYQRLAEIGVLKEDDNVELLNGWIVKKMTKNPPHDSIIDYLTRLLVPQVSRGWTLRVQNSLVTPTSVPEPDFACVRGSGKEFRNRHPRGDEAIFAIEVADSSVRRDREKAAIYAAAGVPVYWIVNIPEQTLEVYSRPTGDRYAATDVLHESETVELPMPVGNLPIKVADLFSLADE